MGDDLARLLYTAFINASDGVAGGDVPNWASLPVAERERWEQVATKARNEMAQRFVRDMRAATEELGAEQAIANLLEARAR